MTSECVLSDTDDSQNLSVSHILGTAVIVRLQVLAALAFSQYQPCLQLVFTYCIHG